MRFNHIIYCPLSARPRTTTDMLVSHSMLRTIAAALAAFLGAAAPAVAQRAENKAGDFDYYSLVLSWSPTHCAEDAGPDDALQCNRSDGRRYAFVLHGLWPQYERGYPENCATRSRPFVPEPTIDRMLDIMPSRGLIIHEYRKHGTCSGLTANEYFGASQALFKSIKIPERFRNPYESQFVSPEETISLFIDSNPELDEDMIAVSCRGSGHRLREVYICFSKDGKPRACGKNENQNDLCRAQKMFVPPVRSSKFEPDTPEARRKAIPNNPLPAPRLIPSLR